MKSFLKVFFVVSTASLAGTATQADLVFSTASGSDAGTATFSIQSGDLKIIIQNTSSTATSSPGDVLTALFFQGGGSGLSVVSETLPTGDSIFQGSTTLSTLSSPTAITATTQSLQAWQAGYSGATYGVGVGGLNFGGFGGINSDKDGLVSSGYPPSSIGGLEHDGDIVIENEIIIELSGANINLNTLRDVQFNFGTTFAPMSTTVVAVPESGTLFAACGVLAPFCLVALRKFRAQA